MVTFSHADLGTAESAWVAAGLSAAPELPLDSGELAALGFVVLAAHPDDETLGAGGLAASLRQLGASVEVLLCTAGEGSHPESATHTPERLAAARLEEFAAALTELGLEGRWRFLGLPDRGLGLHADVIADSVRQAAAKAAGTPAEHRDVVIVAPYRADGHADHDALGAVAADVAAEGGHGLLEYPIWYWHWAGPDHSDWRDWMRFHLDPPARQAKDRAMAAHATQVLPLSPAPGDEALLSEGFLQHFARGYEMFAWTPPRKPAEPSHRSGEATEIFDRVHQRTEDPWNYGSSWYEQRKRALTLAALPEATYAAGLEIGCSIGTLTADLAPRCRSLLAVDASGVAVEQARHRLAAAHHVTVEQAVLPAAWPAGSFDLIVVSEVGYYLARDELAAMWDRVEAAMQPGGTLVLCHWRHPVAGWELDGESVHALARERLGWRQAGMYRERDFLLEVLVAPGPAGTAPA
ncbi:LmbE family protein [Pseudarthrobacter chlorophenolicus A6]|uniref:LmbE family protein n=1 Tax=Pseudarthrobacter chlorophenolicus (strain ATCC 700700 / DSM 12829 / CIP 107037 / JCM 12360 / KCTC 9906 / NCIMB 13794 / A6) TaxID=452863 RepID=B8HB70_PSECP|nr:bifunctional PIG-L family deacetylase/class I SAM-dependent methyltransferase [Pseudarthrobacter chlorophenolicus]ACL38555.1 LmbE family protein [Pseudarthrobacter chlorophenolicus A6]SDQ46298.1 N-acetylglucosaminyl deacetylase, LmbE family [Pseudarthrobacter chlorophenolicus]